MGHLIDLFGRNADGLIEWDARAVYDRGQQVALVAFRVGQQASRVDRAAAFAGDDEGMMLRMGSDPTRSVPPTVLAAAVCWASVVVAVLVVELAVSVSFDWLS